MGYSRHMKWAIVCWMACIPPAAKATGDMLAFQYHVVDSIPNGTDNDLCLVGDIDRDGDPDIVIGGKRGEANLVWYENLRNGSWLKHPIATANLEAGGLLFDVDRDGDLDIIAGQPRGYNELYWFECPEQPRAPWTKRLITDAYNQYHDQAVGDLDGDGKMELVFASQKSGKLLYVTIPDDPTISPWPGIQEIASVESEGLCVVDIDRDGAQDVIFGGQWFEYRDGRWLSHSIADYKLPRVAVADLDLDGVLEIVLAEGEQIGARLAWFDSEDPRNDAWQEHLLTNSLHHPHTLQTLDVNNDGAPDILVGEMGLSENSAKRAIVYVNMRDGRFREFAISTAWGTHESKTLDYDLDGDWDVVIKPYGHPEVALLQNISERPVSFYDFQMVLVDSTKESRSLFVIPADLDGDGWEDIVTGAWWYRNPRVPGSPWIRTRIGESLGNVCYVLDIDRDGDLDVIGTTGEGSRWSGTLLWVESEEHANRWIEHPVFEVRGADFPQGFAAFQPFPSRWDQFVISWHNPAIGLWLVRRGDGHPSGWEARQISAFSQGEDLDIGDIDLDGDPDILLGTAWLENRGAGFQDDWTLHLVGPDEFIPDRNELVDIDRDGDLDFVVTEEKAGDRGVIGWLENPRGHISYDEKWPFHKIGEAFNPLSMDVGDIDGDGDVDVVVGEHALQNPRSGRVILFENVGDAMEWDPHVLDKGHEHHDGTILKDMDNDGDLDIVSISWSEPGLVLLYVNNSSTTTTDIPQHRVPFSATTEKNGVLLQWITIPDFDASKFMVIRTDPDGTQVTVATLTVGVSVKTTDPYEIIDVPPSPGIYVYTLVVVDRTGTPRTAGTVQVVWGTLPRIHVSEPYPCPASTEVYLDWILASRTDLTFEVFDLKGRSVYREHRTDEPPGKHTFVWRAVGSDGALPSGVYLMRVNVAGQSETRKIILVGTR